jgi:hypothetical protein
MSHSVGLHGESRQASTCPNCDIRLVRNPDSEVTSLRQWRRRDDPQDDD